ncbi:MAG TPA: hypothetical protein VKM36_09035 [Balneolaceae bacterium]|nr:hypothetical protein [Balneolaceae bacterium]
MKTTSCFTVIFTVILLLAFIPEAKSQYKDGVVPDTSKFLTDQVSAESLLFSNLALPGNSVSKNYDFFETRATRSIFLLGKIILNNKIDAPHSFKSFYPETVTDFTSGFHFYRQHKEFPILNN